MLQSLLHAVKQTASLPCNLCGGSEVEQVGDRCRNGLKLRTVLCCGCGLVWTDPRPTAEENRQFYSTEYRLSYKAAYAPKPKHALRESRRALERVRHIEAIIQPGMKALDAGCGGGFFLYALKNAGVDAQGVEPNEGFAGYAQQELRVPVQNAFIQDVSFQAETFDLITLNHVLEHVDDPVGTLAILSRWLMPGGYLVVEVPNVESLQHAPLNRYHRGHLYNFNPRTLAGVGRKVGLDVHHSKVLAGSQHCHIIFRKPGADDPITLQLHSVYNYERVRNVLYRHTTLQHFASIGVYWRLLKKQLSYLDEWRRVRSAGCGREIVENVLRKAG